MEKATRSEWLVVWLFYGPVVPTFIVMRDTEQIAP